MNTDGKQSLGDTVQMAGVHLESDPSPSPSLIDGSSTSDTAAMGGRVRDSDSRGGFSSDAIPGIPSTSEKEADCEEEKEEKTEQMAEVANSSSNEPAEPVRVEHPTWENVDILESFLFDRKSSRANALNEKREDVFSCVQGVLIETVSKDVNVNDVHVPLYMLHLLQRDGDRTSTMYRSYHLRVGKNGKLTYNKTDPSEAFPVEDIGAAKGAKIVLAVTNFNTTGMLHVSVVKKLKVGDKISYQTMNTEINCATKWSTLYIPIPDMRGLVFAVAPEVTSENISIYDHVRWRDANDFTVVHLDRSVHNAQFKKKVREMAMEKAEDKGQSEADRLLDNKHLVPLEGVGAVIELNEEEQKMQPKCEKCLACPAEMKWKLWLKTHFICTPCQKLFSADPAYMKSFHSAAPSIASKLVPASSSSSSSSPPASATQDSTMEEQVDHMETEESSETISVAEPTVSPSTETAPEPTPPPPVAASSSSTPVAGVAFAPASGSTDKYAFLSESDPPTAQKAAKVTLRTKKERREFMDQRLFEREMEKHRQKNEYERKQSDLEEERQARWREKHGKRVNQEHVQRMLKKYGKYAYAGGHQFDYARAQDFHSAH